MAREGRTRQVWGQVEDGCLLPPGLHKRQDSRTQGPVCTLRRGWCGFPHDGASQQQTV